MVYYPVTPEEIADGARRMLLKDPDNLCTVPVRTRYEWAPGKFGPMMAWGSPIAYEIRAHNGALYAVFRGDDIPELLPMPVE